MPSWKRETEGTVVHVVVDSLPATLCGIDRRDVGVFVWEPPLATDLCEVCGRRIAHATAQAEEMVASLLSEADRVASDEYARAYQMAKARLRDLMDVVPDGRIKDQLTYARACLARNAPQDAHASLKTWRTTLQSLGVAFPRPC